MNRKLLALAVAGAMFAPAAFADDSSVVLTGVISGSLDIFKRKDMGVGVPDSKDTGIGANATRFQIDGKEAIGGGMAVVFSLAFDQAFSGPSQGGDPAGGAKSGNLFNRNSHIGLAAPWGTLKWGQNEHQYEIQQILQDPFPASENVFNALTLMTGWGFSAPGFAPSGFTRRDAQSIWYTSPNWGGFVLDVAYIPGDKLGARTSNGYQFAGQFGPIAGLTFYGAYAQYNDQGLAADSKDNAIRFGVGWGIGPLQLDASAERLKHDNNTSGVEGKRTNFYIAAGFKVGAGTIRAQFAKAQKVKGNVCNIANCAESTATNFGIGYGHALSKRTEAYAYFGQTKNKSTATFNTGGQGGFGTIGAPGLLAGPPGADTSGFQFGLRHSF